MPRFSPHKNQKWVDTTIVPGEGDGFILDNYNQFWYFSIIAAKTGNFSTFATKNYCFQTMQTKEKNPRFLGQKKCPIKI